MLTEKYRPQLFSEMVGHEKIINFLKQQLEKKEKSGFYFLSGPTGVGKTTMVRILARAICCENPQRGEPCNKCRSCKLHLDGKHHDIIELDIGQLRSVGDIEEIMHIQNYIPRSGGNRVFIFDEAHSMSNTAKESLLKYLENPIEHNFFLFCTTQPHKFPQTLLGRSFHLKLNPLNFEEIKSYLSKIFVDLWETPPDDSYIKLLISRGEDLGLRGIMKNLEILYDNKIFTYEKALEFLPPNASSHDLKTLIKITILKTDFEKAKSLLGSLLQKAPSADALIDEIVENIMEYEIKEGRNPGDTILLRNMLLFDRPYLISQGKRLKPWIHTFWCLYNRGVPSAKEKVKSFNEGQETLIAKFAEVIKANILPRRGYVILDRILCGTQVHIYPPGASFPLEKGKYYMDIDGVGKALAIIYKSKGIKFKDLLNQLIEEKLLQKG
ncbi:MAG: AAA family ATPase [Promethearchaeota archaeon]